MLDAFVTRRAEDAANDLSGWMLCSDSFPCWRLRSVTLCCCALLSLLLLLSAEEDICEVIESPQCDAAGGCAGHDAAGKLVDIECSEWIAQQARNGQTAARAIHAHSGFVGCRCRCCSCRDAAHHRSSLQTHETDEQQRWSRS